MARRVARLLLILCAAVDAGNWELPAEVEAEVGTAYQDDFLKACDGGDEKVVKKLLRTQKDSIDLAGARDKFGQSALTLARVGRHTAVERTVLAALRRLPSWRQALSHDQMAEWIEQHTGASRARAPRPRRARHARARARGVPSRQPGVARDVGHVRKPRVLRGPPAVPGAPRRRARAGQPFAPSAPLCEHTGCDRKGAAFTSSVR